VVPQQAIIGDTKTLTTYSDSYDREAKLLTSRMNRACFTALTGFQGGVNAGERTARAGGILTPTQEQMSLVIEIAHGTQALMIVGLQAATKLQLSGIDGERLDTFLRPVWTWGLPVARGEDPHTEETDTPGALGHSLDEDDVCAACNVPIVKGGCRWMRTPEEGRRLWHVKCLILRGL
jgi:hypothetical protein